MIKKTFFCFFLAIAFWVTGFFSRPLSAAENGASVYKNFCASCHGTSGKGDGPAAAAFNPKPRDMSDCKVMEAESDDTLFKIIKDGSKSVGRSSGMPGFGGALKDPQIQELVAHIRSFCKK